MRPEVRRASSLGLLLALLVPSFFLPLALAGGVEHAGAPDAPFRMPLKGEGAVYRVLTWTEGDSEAREVDVHLRWDVESTLFPGPGDWTFPTLFALVLAPEGEPGSVPRALDWAESADAAMRTGLPPLPSRNPGKDYAAEDPLVVHARHAHVTRPGGELLARSTAWYDKDAGADGSHRGQWVHRVLRADACDLASPETLLARVTALSPADALRAVRGCGAHAEAAEGEDGAWTLAARFAGSVNVTLTAGHGLALPHAWTFDSPRLRQEATLVGWHAGEGFLGQTGTPPAPPRLPLVEWTADGPARGDLADHPFRSAKRALQEQDADAAAFFAEAKDARVLYATHAWTSAGVLAGAEVDGWGSRVKGIPCAGPADAAAPEDGSGEWSLSWASPTEGALFAIAQRVALPAPAPPVERVVQASRDGYLGDAPPTRAPAPADLARHLRALDPYVPTGTRSIDYAFAPSAQGNRYEGAAAVSRGTCERDPATGKLAYVGVSLWFVEGEARAVVGTTIQRATPTPTSDLLASLMPPPAREDDGGGAASPYAGLTLVTGAAIAVVGGAALAAALAPRLLQALYTRIHRGDALENEKRARLLEAIIRRPGAPIRDVADELGMPVNTAEHHARVLRRLRYVRRVRTASGVAYYPIEHPRAAHAHVLDRAHADAVLDALATRPDQTQRELALAVGMRKTHLSGLLRDLETEGLVERRREGRHVRVRATERALALRAGA